MNKDRLAVVLGAGSTQELGFPTTQDLTKRLMKDCAAVCAAAVELACKTNFNFEVLFQHLLDNYRVVHSVQNSIDLDRKQTLQDLQCGIRSVKEAIIGAAVNRNYLAQFCNFYHELAESFDLDIVSLNYDSLFETDIFGEAIENGFTVRTGNFLRFDNTFDAHIPDRHRILRLHGCINFIAAYDLDVVTTDNESITDNFQTHSMYWSNDARQTLSTTISSFGGQQVPDGGIAFSKGAPVSPIITGLNKEDFFSVEPYHSYYEMLKDLFQNPRLLVVGYNYNNNDHHLNQHLQHQRKRVLINMNPALPPELDNETCLQLSTGFMDSAHKIGMIVDHLRAV